MSAEGASRDAEGARSARTGWARYTSLRTVARMAPFNRIADSITALAAGEPASLDALARRAGLSPAHYGVALKRSGARAICSDEEARRRRDGTARLASEGCTPCQI